MALEIERKFLVTSKSYKKESFKKYTITQGFLSTAKNAVVRIRIQDNTAFITIKGKSNKAGTKRYEWEKSISTKEARELLALNTTALIEKTRYLIKIKNHTFEVDEFQRDNKGLVVAEIELNSEEESFEKPNWLGEEVTGIKKYYNAKLSINPYKNWKTK
jgi:adenylate cyclase